VVTTAPELEIPVKVPEVEAVELQPFTVLPVIFITPAADRFVIPVRLAVVAEAPVIAELRTVLLLMLWVAVAKPAELIP
jgi:hypothetical protein